MNNQKLELSLEKNIIPSERERIKDQVINGIINDADRFKVRLVQNGLRLPLNPNKSDVKGNM
jgi:hypothetical protein